MDKKAAPHIFDSVSSLHRALGLPAPQHPLISIANYGDITADVTELSKALVLNMYKVSFKFNLKGRFRYGQDYYDFDEGGLSFAAPMQVISASEEEMDYSGLTLLIHPDFLRSYPLAQTIKDFGFFSYSVNEALYLSEQEKVVITGIFESIRRELSTSIAMLRSLTGMNTQQFVQSKMVEKAKELLSTGTLTVSVIAYRLGFEYPQSFNKFFKRQTKLSPLDYRQSFN